MASEASHRLDKFLQSAIDELGGKDVPESSDTGAKKGVQSLSDVMAEIKAMISQSIDRSKFKMLEQGKKMAADYEANSNLVVQKMDDQHQEAMTQFNDLLGNERAGDVE